MTQKLLYSPNSFTVKKVGIRPPEKNMGMTNSIISGVRNTRSLRDRGYAAAMFTNRPKAVPSTV